MPPSGTDTGNAHVRHKRIHNSTSYYPSHAYCNSCKLPPPSSGRSRTGEKKCDLQAQKFFGMKVITPFRFALQRDVLPIPPGCVRYHKFVYLYVQSGREIGSVTKKSVENVPTDSLLFFSQLKYASRRSSPVKDRRQEKTFKYRETEGGVLPRSAPHPDRVTKESLWTQPYRTPRAKRT